MIAYYDNHYFNAAVNEALGIEDDNDALLNTAYEINAFNISDGTSFSN